MRLEVVELEHRAGPRPFWFKAWIKLPDGREAGIDVIWDSRYPLKPIHRERIEAKAAWMAEAGHPYIFLEKNKAPEIELALRLWIRKLANDRGRDEVGAKDPGQPAQPSPDHPA